MRTDLPTWAQAVMNKAGKAAPLPSKPLPPVGGGAPSSQPAAASQAQVAAVRNAAAATSHNVFRPDVYRVSGGYLN